MKIENIREVKTRFSRYIKDLSKTGAVVITKNGRPCAALVPVTDISASKRYWVEDIIEPEVTVSSRGTIAVSSAPGIGYNVKMDLIEKLTTRTERLV